MAKRKRKQIGVGATDGKRLFQVFRHEDGTHAVLLEDEPTSSDGMEFVGEVYAKNFLDAHVAVVGELPQLDEPIKPLVLLLNELGYWTNYCCSGHATDPTDPDEGRRGYVSLYLEQAEDLGRLKKLLVDIFDEEDGPCDCEGPCENLDGHEPLRFVRNRTTPLPSPNMGLSLEWDVQSLYHGEWGVTLHFKGYERPLSALDYAWLVEQIERRTGRAKPLPLTDLMVHKKQRLTIQRLL